MITIKPTVILLATLVSTLTACGEVTTKVTVLDEKEAPVTDARVRVFHKGYHRDNEVIIEKQTDLDGVANTIGSPKGGAPLAALYVFVDKAGYYKFQRKKLDYKQTSHNLKVILRPIENPIPLYAKKAIAILPQIDSAIGYDFMKGDWVKPHGLGETVDIYLSATKSVTSPTNFESILTVSFPNKFDGIQVDEVYTPYSDFKSSRKAPQSGYVDSMEFNCSKTPEGGYEKQTPLNNYLLRVRSEVDENGEFKSAHYVKLYDAFKNYIGVQTATPPGIGFTYYFNPTSNDRNLEFDPDQNLLKGLSRDEIVKNP
jgi:hypothetical protein